MRESLMHQLGFLALLFSEVRSSTRFRLSHVRLASICLCADSGLIFSAFPYLSGRQAGRAHSLCRRLCRCASMLDSHHIRAFQDGRAAEGRKTVTGLDLPRDTPSQRRCAIFLSDQSWRAVQRTFTGVSYILSLCVTVGRNAASLDLLAPHQSVLALLFFLPSPLSQTEL